MANPLISSHHGKKNKYTQAFLDQNGPGDGRPTALDILQDNNCIGTMKDKVFLLTGSSGGIGIETGRALAATGGRVYLGVRDVVKGQEALAEVLEPGRVELLELDIGSMDSIRAAAEQFLSKSTQLNVLVNNAGITACPEAKTVDGFESQLAINYLGHFLLYKLLEQTLLTSSTPEFASRVVNVSSAGHHMSPVVLENINLEGEYEAWKAYGNAKTACIWMTNEIERRHGSQGLHGLSLMPGGIATDLQRHVDPKTLEQWVLSEPSRKYGKSTAQGAATTMTAAFGKEWEGKGGVYLEDCQEAGPVPDGGTLAVGVAPHAFNPEGEKALWALSIEMLNLVE
ncbi:Putative Short-chain dehydrogenase [[Torrubiella] hemipterigena]|uniref:Putative Short-chain dehydrogenase n=1 Tax=[Torrubiella] hemipterigena TaxID=1531966 RepID=A0A0A1T995_9HYPO|nr:Putative Short-chain dehydrogenase [[Torrubiella] hemipterigena]